MDGTIKPEYYEIGRLGLFTGNHVCIVKAKQLAKSASILLAGDENDCTHALGLYTLAIEEFGKAILLKEYFKDDDESIQNIPTNIFTGNKSHEIKFQKALDNLPEVCKNIFVGIWTVFPSGADRKIRIGRRGPHVFVPKDRTGTFSAQYAPNFEVRMNCFYVDWDVIQKKWSFNLKVTKKDLETAIEKFNERILNYDIVHLQEKKTV